MYKAFRFAGFCLLFCITQALAGWLEISGVEARLERTEFGGPRVVIEYILEENDISAGSPAYVFVRWTRDQARGAWRLIPEKSLRYGGIVESGGRKRIVWWGIGEMNIEDIGTAGFQVRGVRMVRVPVGEFIMKTTPGGGYGDAKKEKGATFLSEFYMAKYETTVSMYADYLKETSAEGAGWSKRMADSARCGITRHRENPPYSFSVLPGRENYPVTCVSWYDALGFLDWCGLCLPNEAEWEKAYRGGIFLDGDSLKTTPNSLPERNYPWGDEPPGTDGVFRCNMRGEEDGRPHTAPVGSFSQYDSPYGACDMAGNVAEWTVDWYTTSYHADLDGFRMLRGGSWRSPAVAVDAISGATGLPVREGSIMGFRGVKR